MLRPNSIVAITIEATGIFFLKKTIDMHSTECSREVQYFGVFLLVKKTLRPNSIIEIIIKATGFSF